MNISLIEFGEIAMWKSSRHVCSKCNKVFASPQSLWNHKQRCQGLTVERKKSMSLDILTFKVNDNKRLAVKRPFDVMYNGQRKKLNHRI